MAFSVNLYYAGDDSNARRFAEEMMSSGTVDAIRSEPGNLRYEYFSSLEDPNTVLLIDSWENQASLDTHHESPMMQTIMNLREKYGLRVTAERFMTDEEGFSAKDESFLQSK